ncbi:methyltransferase-like protein 27 isoform X2 [Procambarus clarkii]|uniref:methyltransferase-like protein 27 isoform X2 n=2 Tax=Procambarus clarkii TaxID=6728 RepID=UPI003741FA2F
MDCANYRGPLIAADYVTQMVPEDRRQHVRVMDIAAGTGAIGLELHKKGFTNIDALDPSEGMLKVLKETGVYNLIYQEFISQDPTTIPEGGLVIIVTGVNYLTAVEAYKDKLEPHMERLEQQGLWHKVVRTVVPNYFVEIDGVVYIYRVVSD